MDSVPEHWASFVKLSQRREGPCVPERRLCGSFEPDEASAAGDAQKDGD